jgi:hypothetical protein
MVGRLRKSCLFIRSLILKDDDRIQVNNLSQSLLALLLLPRMIQTSKEYTTAPRLVVVSSEVHFFAALNQDISESPKILEAIGSKEYSTKPGVMNGRYPLTKREYI